MAKHSLVRLKGSLLDTPHLVDEKTFNTILEYVDKRIEGGVDVLPKMMEDDDEDDVYTTSYNYNPDTRTGFLNISGPTTYRRTGWEALCGGTSYEALKEQMRYFVEQGARTVVMDVNSGGGEALGMIDSAQYIRKLADENDIYIVGFADGSACSAAYGLLCVADEVVSSIDSSVGSVGVLISLLDSSKAMEKGGYRRVFVTAGKSKVPFAEDGSIKQEFIDRLQTQVDELYERFTEHVAVNRGMTQEAVKNTEADVFSAKEALEIGFIDSIKTFEQFDDYLLELSSQRNREEEKVSGNFLNRFKLSKQEDKVEMAQIQELQALLETKEAELAASLDQVASMSASMAELQDQLQSLQAFAEEHKAAAEAAKAEAARIAEEQARAKVDQRKAALAEVVAGDKLEATYGALASLDDSAFELIVSQYAAAKDAMAESFKALGGEGVEQEHTAAEHGSVDAIRQAGVQKARERYAAK